MPEKDGFPLPPPPYCAFCASCVEECAVARAYFVSHVLLSLCRMGRAPLRMESRLLSR